MAKTIEGYFGPKARRWFAQAGGNPDNAGQLAEWAASAHKDSRRHTGAVVTETGRVVAETYRTTTGGVYASYVPSETMRSLTGQAVPNELGLALGAIRQAVGEEVAHVSYSDLCEGEN